MSGSSSDAVLRAVGGQSDRYARSISVAPFWSFSAPSSGRDATAASAAMRPISAAHPSTSARSYSVEIALVIGTWIVSTRMRRSPHVVVYSSAACTHALA